MGYLVNLSIEGKPAVVIGGGEVAARKVADLLAARARVTVVAPEACQAILDLADEKRIVLHLRPYWASDLAGAFVAIASTDDEEVNRTVAADAARQNLPINVVDRPALCTFTVPATVSRGNLTIAVATEGRCPALSGILREELEQRYGPEYGELVELFGDLRERMIARGWNGQAIRDKLREIYRAGAAARIAAGERDGFDDFLRERESI